MLEIYIVLITKKKKSLQSLLNKHNCTSTNIKDFYYQTKCLKSSVSINILMRHSCVPIHNISIINVLNLKSTRCLYMISAKYVCMYAYELTFAYAVLSNMLFVFPQQTREICLSILKKKKKPSNTIPLTGNKTC